MLADAAQASFETGLSQRRVLAFIFLALSAHPALVLSASSSSCASDSKPSPALPEFSEDKRDQLNISADSTRTSTNSNTVFQGNVIIKQHQSRIATDHAEYNDELQGISLDGNVRVSTPAMELTAQQGMVSIESGESSFNNVNFNISDNILRGHAESIQASQDNDSQLQHAYITSCPPEDNSWRLDAGDITLNHKEEYGSAEDVVLRFKNMPFFYTPYIEFPIGERRRSGLLIPEFGDSSSRGFELSIPWYWNIAPNQDAILAPHFMSRRGTQLDTQYRYLTESSKGQFKSAYLNKDTITGDKRYQLRYQQQSDITSNLKLDIDVQDVSDTNYYNDFSNDITGTSTTHLNRSAQLAYTRDNWSARLLAQSFETVDNNIALFDRPYRSLPKLTLTGEQVIGNSSFVFGLDSEWVNYDHEDKTRITGSRTTVKPELSLPMLGSYWFVTPAVSYSLTNYNVKDGSGNTLTLDTRKLTSRSLDAGLFFERQLDNELVQTLEPRMYYLNVPYADQSSLPLFDTSTPDFSIAQLFRDNRFIGGDRIGDANQLTLALSSRLLNPTTGNELMRASLGQILYFEDRRVNLLGNTKTDSSSASIAELSVSSQHWRSTASIQWNSHSKRSEKQNFLLHYQSDQRYTKNTQIFNIGYRLRDDGGISSSNIEQSDVSFVTPVSKDYALFARWNYSLKDKRDIDVIGGLAYDSCCWSVQLLAQRRLNSSSFAAKYDNSLMVQLVLKGLGSVSGNNAYTTLSRAIPGYSEE